MARKHPPTTRRKSPTNNRRTHRTHKPRLLMATPPRHPKPNHPNAKHDQQQLPSTPRNSLHNRRRRKKTQKPRKNSPRTHRNHNQRSLQNKVPNQRTKRNHQTTHQPTRRIHRKFCKHQKRINNQLIAGNLRETTLLRNSTQPPNQRSNLPFYYQKQTTY